MSKFEESLKSGVHAGLQKLTGEWEGHTKVWFEPGKLADESPTRATIKSILGGRFVLYEYSGSLQGKPIEGLAIIGHFMNTGKYECAWVDSFHMGTAIMFSKGEKRDAGFSVTGQYAEETGTPWGWRTETILESDSDLVITAYNITPEGEEAKAVESRYRRVK